MSLLSRDLLVEVLKDPRLVGEFETLDQQLTEKAEQLAAVLETATSLVARLNAVEAASIQPHSSRLDAISALPDNSGVIELLGAGSVQVRGIDTTDDASLVSREQLISFAGKGATGSRPTLSAARRAIYFDTTLGKPVFWDGAAWITA